MGDSVGIVLRGVQTLRTDFLTTLKEAPKIWSEHMMPNTSDGEKETQLFGGTAPKVRKWVDERQPGGLHAVTFDIVNERFENSISVDIPSLERDKIDFHRRNIKGLATRMMNYPFTGLANLRLLGATNLCWDGQPFFSTAHKFRGSGAQSNKLTQTGVTAANVATDFYLAEKASLTWKDDQGEIDDSAPYFTKWVIVHGFSMRQVLREVFETEDLSTGGKNPLYGKAELRLDPRITGNGWILENLGREVKPYGIQEEIPLRLSNTDPSSDEAFNRGSLKFGTEWRGQFFYGEPSCAILVGTL